MINRDLKITGISLLAWALGEGLFANIVPIYLEELGADPVQIGSFTALFFLAQALVLLPGGLAADRWGAKRIMMIGWGFGVLVSIIMAVASDLYLFTLGWIGYGLTMWPIPALTSYIAMGRGNLSPQRSMTRVYAYYSAGLVISPSIGGLIAQLIGFRSVFYLSIVFFFISFLLISRLGNQPPLKIGSSSQRYKGLTRNKNYIFIMIIALVMNFTLYLGYPMASIFLKANWGLNLSQIGLLGSIASLGEVILALSLGNFHPRKSLVFVLLAGTVYLVVILYTGSMVWLAVAFFLRVGVSISRQFVDAMSSHVVSPPQYGLAFAINSTAGRIATVVASGAAGWLYSIRAGLVFQIGLFLIPIVLVLIQFLVPKEEQHQSMAADAGS
ncbi:MAG: MFS transporter [Anaerolineales bacterium]|nr:MFS transporter [Anaerolineales bacterium]